MAKRATRKNGTNYPAANQTRGLTDLQKRINKATGVDSNYNFNRGSAYDSAREFVKAEWEAAKNSGDKERKRGHKMEPLFEVLYIFWSLQAF